MPKKILNNFNKFFKSHFFCHIYRVYYNYENKQTFVKKIVVKELVGKKAKMKTQLKKVIRFYFSAGSLKSALDGLICSVAASSWKEPFGGERTFDRVTALIGVKEVLSHFWARLNGVMEKLPVSDVLALKKYSALRVGTTNLPQEERRKIHSALIKFKRRAGRVLSACGDAYKCVCAYYAIIAPSPD